MKRKRHTPVQVVEKLREADRLLNAGRSIGQVLQALAAVALATVFSTNAHAVPLITVTPTEVTFTASGDFNANDGGGAWVMTAIAPIAALENWHVTFDDWTTFEMQVAAGTAAGQPDYTYTKHQVFSAAPGMVFSGTLAALASVDNVVHPPVPYRRTRGLSKWTTAVIIFGSFVVVGWLARHVCRPRNPSDWLSF